MLPFALVRTLAFALASRMLFALVRSLAFALALRSWKKLVGNIVREGPRRKNPGLSEK